MAHQVSFRSIKTLDWRRLRVTRVYFTTLYVGYPSKRIKDLRFLFELFFALKIITRNVNYVEFLILLRKKPTPVRFVIRCSFRSVVKQYSYKYVLAYNIIYVSYSFKNNHFEYRPEREIDFASRCYLYI